MLSRDEERNSSTDFADTTSVSVRLFQSETVLMNMISGSNTSYTKAVCTPKLCENNRVSRSVMKKTTGTLVDLQLYQWSYSKRKVSHLTAFADHVSLSQTAKLVRPLFSVKQHHNLKHK